MLYRLGMILMLVGIIFADSDSLMIPLGIVSTGIVLMIIGGNKDEETDAER